MIDWLKRLFGIYKTYTYEHKGYILEQTSYNWHYMIFKADTGDWVSHASCNKKLTEDAAKEAIDFYLELIKK